ncbi:MAG: glycosyltransferase, partial [Myxococcota bacterium]
MNDLVLVPTLSAERNAAGNIVLTRKFIDGVHEWARRWAGDVRLLMEVSDQPSDNLDPVEVGSSELPYRVDVVDYQSPSIVPYLQDASVVVGGAHFRQVGLTAACREAGVPFVYCTEYTLRTRLQIVRTSGIHPLRQARRAYWEWSLEQKHLEVIRSCAGVQCNGTPTFDVYRKHNPNTMLYFDTRVRPDQIVTEETLERRLTRLDRQEPLRLVFSGRLNRMKGADHLVPLAKKLRERGIAFHMSVCGDGECVPQMEADIARWGLNRYVTLRGVLDFNEELLPFVREACDLFVCCHRQGDP